MGTGPSLEVRLRRHTVRGLWLAGVVLLIVVAASIGLDQVTGNAAMTMAELDRDLFDAYNRCDLEKLAGLVAADVEFYHDQTGLTRTRTNLVEAVKKNVCGKVRRELVKSSLQTFPMNDYGVVQLGTHRFCEIGAKKCGGVARFVHLWQNQGGVWQLTRVISYDHQAVP